MGRYKSKNPTVSKGFSMAPDIYDMLVEQSNDAGLTMSGYITRLILEKDTEKRVREQIEKERIIESQMNSSEQK